MKALKKRFTPEAKRLIRKLPPGVKSPLRTLTDEVLMDPLLGKELRDKLKGFRSARYSHYRVIYEYEEKEGWITIHYLGERKNIYDLFEKFLKQN